MNIRKIQQVRIAGSLIFNYFCIMKAHVTLILSLALLSGLTASGVNPAGISEKAMEGFRLFLRDSLPDDRSKGYAMMAEAAWEGDPKGANNLGWILQHGLNGRTDLPGALRWYERAAEQGLPAAALNYVDLVTTHPEALEGKLPDRHRLAKAAMLAGSALAMGRGLPYDYRKGEELIFMAGLLGDEKAAITIAQQLEMYPDSFSYLPIEKIVETCGALFPDGGGNIPEGVDRATLLTPGFWYSKAPARKEF